MIGQFIIPIAHAASVIGSVEGKAGTAVSETTSGIQQLLQTLWDKIPYFFAAVIVIVVTWVLANSARRAAEKTLMRSSQNPGALDLVGKSAQGGVLTIGLVVSLEILGIDLSLIISAFGFGIGFALKDIIANYFAGVLILIQQPFKVSDLIEVGGTMSKVETIEARNIIIRSLDGQKVIVSNTDIFTTQIINYSHYPDRRIRLPIGVDYSSDLPQVIDIIQTVLEENRFVLKKPAPQVIFLEFGDSSINLEARFWVSVIENWFELRSEIITQIKREFDLQGINIPFPIRTIKTDSGEPLSMDTARVDKLEHKEHRPTRALGEHQDRVSVKDATDHFDPQQGVHRRKVVAPGLSPTTNKSPESKPDSDIFDAQADPEKESSSKIKAVKSKDSKDPLFV